MKYRSEARQGRSDTRRRSAMTAPARPTPRQLVKALAACSVVSFWAAGTDVLAQALPTGMSPVAGQVSARINGSAMTVTNSPNAIINWNSFSIGAANSVRFNQANASSQVLNRVTGNDPSSILGSLSSNGRVWLLNQNGVLFGRGARVDVAGLVASTLNLTDTDWLTGRLQFTSDGAKAADIVNLGELRSTLGGQIALLGGSVRNEGVIDAPGGQVLLAAGSSIELVDSMTPNVSVKLGTTPGEAVNLGRLSAAGGRVDIEAGIVNQDGIVRADALERGPGGEVVLRARDQLNLGAASQTSASGDSGGKITLEADQTTVRGAVSATGSQAAGGQVHLLGRLVGVLDAARVDVSGAGGGGEVLVGGGQQGKDPSVPNAQAVYFGPQAGIAADAIESGDGGRVILWSDQATRAYGSLSARGGATGGHGGFIETSGGWLDARPSKVDLSAPKGSGGLWLLDPFDVTINDAGPDTGYDPSFTANAIGTTISTSVIKGQLDLGNGVTISTGGGAGPQAGNIVMANATLSVTGSSPGNLALIADGNITITGSTIQSLSGPMSMELLAGQRGDGSVIVQNSSISSGNGSITLGGFGFNTGISGGYCIPPAGGCAAYSYPFPNNNVAHSSTNPGVQLVNSTLNAGTGSLGGGGGTISIAGDSGALNGVEFVSSTLGAETIQIRGSSTNSFGVLVNNTNMTTTRDLSIQGVGGQDGMLVDTNSSLVSSHGTSGNFSLSLVGASTSNFSGVRVDGTLTGGNGNSVSISALNVAGPNAPALLVLGANITVGSAPGSLTLGIIDPSIDNNIIINNSTLSGTAGGILMSGARTLTLQNTSITGRTMQFQADNVDLAGSTSVVSHSVSGDVFVFTNRWGIGPLTSFINNSTVGSFGSGALQTDGPPARWIIWASDIASSAFNPGSLPYDFTMYGAASSSAWSATAGNGYVSAAPGVASVVGTINSRVYDTTVSVPLQGALQATGPRGEVAVFGSPPGLQYADKNVGIAKPVELFGSYTVSFSDSLGKPTFGMTLQSGMTGDVTPATIPLQGLSGNSKFYDSTNAATYSGTASVTPLGSDNVTVSIPIGAPGFFADKNVGNGKAITIPSMSLTGADAANYLLNTSSLTANILPFQLSLSGVTVNNKVYDTTVNATLNGTPGANFFAGDSIALTGGTALFTDKNAGTNKPVRVSGFGLSGADAGNYLAPPTTLLTADITPATLFLSGLSSANKVYDATTSATLSGSVSVTPLSGDFVGVVGTPFGSFADKNVGIAKPVSVGGLNLTGNDSPNYVLAAPASLTADITPATLVVSGLVANNKVYDATTLATLSGTASVVPLSEDLVSVSATPTGTFSDKNVGTAKSVSISAGILTGPDAGNYIPVSSAALSADITPATLVVSGLVANNKVYDATSLATLSGTATVSPLGSDSVNVSGTPVGAFSDPNVGSAKRVAVSSVTLSGADAGNYVAVASAPLSADITPATLRYVATPAVSGVGQPPPPLGGTVAGFLGPDTLVNSTSGTLAFTTSVTSLTPPGFYPIFGQGLLALNYIFVQDPANATAMSVGNGQLVPVAQSSDVLIANTVESVTEPPMMTKLGAGGLLDLTTQPAPTRTTTSGSASAGGGGGGGGLGLPIGSAQPTAFDPVDLASQSQGELEEMLATRDRFKQELFAEATSKLERDPKLADVPPCQTLKEIDLGKCLLTESLKREWLASAPTADRQSSAGGAAGASSGASPGATAVAPARPADSGVAPGQQAAPAAAAAPEAVLTLPAIKRHVVTAALPQIDRKVALVIGVDNYDDPSIPHLANSVKDARAVGHMLESQLGYETIVLENPNKKTVITALNRFALELKVTDSMIIYYAGHGDVVEATKLGYWQLADSDAKHPESWLSNADIGRLIGQLGASQVALISDSCYSGSLVSEVRIRAATGAVDPVQLLAGRSVVVMSSGGNEPVFDEGKDGHSPFAWNLMNTLGNLSNWQAGGHVFERVRFGVARELPQRPQYGAYVAGGQQYNGGDYLFEQRQLESNPR